MLPGWRITASPALMPSTISTWSPDRRPVLHPLLHRLALFDADHLLDAGEGDDGGGGHEHGRVGGLDDDLGAGEGAGAQAAVGVGHFGLHHQRAVVLADGRADPGHPARVLQGIAFDGQLHLLPDLDAGRLALGHGQTQPQGMDPHQHGDGLARGHVVAGARQAVADGAVEGSGQGRVGELLAGDRELAPALREQALARAGRLDGFLEAAFGHAESGIGGVEVRAGDELLVEEPGHAVAGELSLLESRRRLLDEGGLVRESRRRPAHPGRRPIWVRACCRALSAWRIRSSESVGTSRRDHLACAVRASRCPRRSRWRRPATLKPARPARRRRASPTRRPSAPAGPPRPSRAVPRERVRPLPCPSGLHSGHRPSRGRRRSRPAERPLPEPRSSKLPTSSRLVSPQDSSAGRRRGTRYASTGLKLRRGTHIPGDAWEGVTEL